MKPTQPDSRDAFDFDQWKERDEVEFKFAAGKDGRGALPDSVWETYSAMANTGGGIIVLGVRERSDRSLEFKGIADIEKVTRAVLNNV